jgi:hypothetical protein
MTLSGYSNPQPPSFGKATAAKAALAALALIVYVQVADSADSETKFQLQFNPPLSGIQKAKIQHRPINEEKWKDLDEVPLPLPGYIVKKIDCEKETYFTAVVFNVLYELKVEDREKKCGQREFVFNFVAKKYGVELEKAINNQFANIELGTSGGASFSYFVRKYEGGSGALFGPYGPVASLKDTIEKGDIELSLKQSSEMYSGLKAAGFHTVAEQYRLLNLDLAKSAVTGKSHGLFYDPFQKKYVLDEDTVTMIKEFQTKKNLQASGNVDWPTMTYIGKMGLYP